MAHMRVWVYVHAHGVFTCMCTCMLSLPPSLPPSLPHSLPRSLTFSLSLNILTDRCSLHDVYRTLVIASCGRLSGLAAMVWTGDFYLWIPLLLVIPAQLQSFRGIILTIILHLYTCSTIYHIILLHNLLYACTSPLFQ